MPGILGTPNYQDVDEEQARVKSLIALAAGILGAPTGQLHTGMGMGFYGGSQAYDQEIARQQQVMSQGFRDELGAGQLGNQERYQDYLQDTLAQRQGQFDAEQRQTEAGMKLAEGEQQERKAAMLSYLAETGNNWIAQHKADAFLRPYAEVEMAYNDQRMSDEFQQALDLTEAANRGGGQDTGMPDFGDLEKRAQAIYSKGVLEDKDGNLTWEGMPVRNPAAIQRQIMDQILESEYPAYWKLMNPEVEPEAEVTSTPQDKWREKNPFGTRYDYESETASAKPDIDPDLERAVEILAKEQGLDPEAVRQMLMDQMKNLSPEQVRQIWIDRAKTIQWQSGAAGKVEVPPLGRHY